MFFFQVFLWWGVYIMAKIKLKVKSEKNKKFSAIRKEKGLSTDLKDHVTKSALTTLMLEGMSFNDAVKSLSLSKIYVTRLRLDPVFQEFIDKVQIDFEHRHLSNINVAGDAGNWKASAWMLERLRPDKYGKKDTVRLEYSTKLESFKNLMLEVLNECDPVLKQKVMQKLRAIDIDGRVKQVEALQIGFNNAPDVIDIVSEE